MTAVKKWLMIGGVAFLIALISVLMFVFGYRHGITDGKKQGTSESTTKTSVPNSNISTDIPQIPLGTNPTGVFWIKTGQEPLCPTTHPIKATFNESGAGYFYTKDSKMYDRIKPDICFSDANFAQDVAGFVRKF